MRKLTLMLLVFFFGLIAVSKSQNKQAQVLLDSAKSCYDKGEYQTACLIYKAFVDSGVVSEGVYYNLGNCFFKLGDKPQAVLYYEKTLKLNGRNENAEHNLDIVNSTLIDKFEKIPSFSMRPLFKGINPFISYNLLGILSVCCLSLAIYLFYRMKNNGTKFTFLNSWIILVVSLVLYIWGAVQKSQIEGVSAGIVSKNGVKILSEPNANATLLFELNEGTKVEFIEKNKSWYNVKTKDGNQGWVQSILILSI